MLNSASNVAKSFDGGDVAMKRSFTPYIILAILFAVFNVFAFAIPSDNTSTFWVAYGFTVAMFCVEVVVLLIAFSKDNTPKKQFLSWPRIYVGMVYFIIQTVLFFPFKLFPNIPSWIAVIVFSFLFGIELVCIIATKASTNLIKHYDDSRKR